MRMTDGTRRQIAAWLGGVLLLANILLAPALGYRPMALSAEGGLVICTSEGRIVLGPSGEKLPDAPEHDQHICAFCLPLSSPETALLGHGGPALPLPRLVAAFHFGEVSSFALIQAAQPGGYARGPPTAA